METSDIYETVFEAVTDALRAEAGGTDLRLNKRMVEGSVTFTDGEGRVVKEMPIFPVFRKVTAVREKLRVLEQKVNSNKSLSTTEQAELQSYITKCYGSLTTFNFLFADEDDKFQGDRRMKFIATVASGLEPVLAEELKGLGATAVVEGRKSVGFRGDLEMGLRACLWSRVASRILHPLARVPARYDGELYDGVAAIDWQQHWRPGTTICVDFVGHSDELRDSRYGAMKVKDAICDRLREQLGTRPDVDTKNPDLRINVHLRNNQATISIDMAGVPLHVRGRDRDGGPAPLKENLAAALLMLSGWRGASAEGAVLVDPFCGSGTILIEAADVLADRAPGLLRRDWGFAGWMQHDIAVWAKLHDEARARVRPVPKGRLFGRDLDEGQLARCRGNLSRAGLTDAVTLEQGDMRDARPPVENPGIWVTNPPYGERLGETESAVALSRDIGDNLRRNWLGWTGWVLAGSPKLARQFGLKPAVKFELRNGSLDCRLVCLPINDKPVARDA